MDKANQARTRILRFGDEARRGLPHTQEHWEAVLRDIDAYEKYCDSHKEYINSKAVSTIAFLRASYAENLEQNDFLQKEEKRMVKMYHCCCIADLHLNCNMVYSILSATNKISNTK